MSDPRMSVNEIPNVEIGKTVGVVGGVGTAIDVLKLGVWIGVGMMSVSVLSDVEVVGTLSGYWSR